MSKQRDQDFWNDVETYEKLRELRSELNKEIEEIKTRLFRGLSIEKTGDGTRYWNNKRVTIVGSDSTTFSVTELREKFGEEWVQENSKKTSSATIQVKYMKRRGPESHQY